MSFIPPSLFRRFKSLQAVDFNGVGLQVITVKTFKSALNVKKFYLYNNQLNSLSGNIFSTTKAEEIYLRDNLISQISWNAFADCPNLLTLELYKNRLSYALDSRLFKNLLNLRTLLLWGNQLSEIPTDAFINLQKLTFLSIGINRLTKLETAAFKHLTALEILHLDANEITYIERNFFNSFPRLRNLKFEKNPCADFNVDAIRNLEVEVNGRLGNCFNGKLICETTCKASY